MAGGCGRTYRIGPRVDPATCNALQDGAAGLLVPDVRLQAGPGLTVTPPADEACPAVWRVDVDGAWAQTGVLEFNQALPVTNRVWHQVTGATPVTIPRAGVWEIDYQVRGAATLTTNATAAQSTGLSTCLYKNGTLMGGSELLVVFHSLAAGDEARQVQATGSRRFVAGAFTAGDQLQLMACQIGAQGTVHVMSNGDGRTYVTASWLGPAGDTGT